MLFRKNKTRKHICRWCDFSDLNFYYGVKSYDDIPRDWTGYYEGLGAKYGEKRGMDMHISNIEPDGSIIK